MTRIYDADRCIHRNDHGRPRGRITPAGKQAAVLAVVVTIAKGYDLGYIWKTQDHTAGRTTGGYYIDAAQAGEPPGRWWGPGARALGFTPGQTVDRQPYDAVYRQADPRTGARLGRARGRYPTFADHLARLTAAEPHTTAERLIELEREAARATRQPAAYYDVTVSFSKSISVLHASIRENERRARLAGDQRTAAYWAGQEQAFQEVLHRANWAALKYLQAWAGITRTGYHGTRVDGREPGRFEPAGLIVTSWLQGTSRDGDPQDHIHNQIAPITRTYRDGKWRALDTMSVRGVLAPCRPSPPPRWNASSRASSAWTGSHARTGAATRSAASCRRRWTPTPPAPCRCAKRNASSRGRGSASTAVRRPRASCCTSPTTPRWNHARAKTRARSTGMCWPRGGTPRSAASWPTSRPRCRTRAAPARERASITVAGRRPDRPRARPQARALAKALTLVSDQHPAWTRHDLLKQLALVLPPETRRMSPEQAQELLLGLAEEALSGRTGEVVCLEAPEWPPLPASLRRQLDGCSIYSRPGVARYATTAQLTLEECLVARAQAQRAPHLPG